MAGELDDADEFQSPNRIRLPQDADVLYGRYPHAVPGSLRFNTAVNKWEADISCTVPGCSERRPCFVSDLFQVKLCWEHKKLERQRQRAEKQRALDRFRGNLGESVLDDQDEFEYDDYFDEYYDPDFCMMPDCVERTDSGSVFCKLHNPARRMPVSDVPVTEELGGIRPAHLLVKAKNDASWIEYVDSEGNTKFMQVHDVRSARDAFGRWAIYGIDQNGDPVHELYDLRHGFEHSGTFSGMRELMSGELVRLVQQGVIRGRDGKEIKTLSGLTEIADEPLRKMIVKKAREAKAGGPALADIEKQLFAGPTASSAQKRRTGKAGTSPWASTLMSS